MRAKKVKQKVSHERFHSLQKNAKTKIFLMPSHQTDVNGFKSDLFLFPYGPLEPMVINFTCDLSLVCIPPCLIPPDFIAILICGMVIKS